ncbi:MAG: M28 family peptidase [Planctomycetes bacterium]|nr:M28 family peptidase [Planctomycetota bacterium]
MKVFLFWIIVAGLFFAGAMMFMTQMPGQPALSASGAMTEDETTVADRLTNHVDSLAREIGARGPGAPGKYADAASYIGTMLKRAGLQVREIPFESKGLQARNIEATLQGTRKKDEILLLGANYDSDLKSPGAEDNASGCAVLLEIARLLGDSANERTVRFVFFGNGAGDFAGEEKSGSWIYAREAQKRGDKIVTMLNFNCLGNYKDTPGSQSIPFPMGAAYPGTGNFLLIAGDLSAREIVRNTVGEFRRNARFPCHGLALPGIVPGWSNGDHAGFIRFGYPAIVVTDTGKWRFENAGTLFDTPDRIVDYPKMARVTVGMAKVVTALAKSSGAL